MKKVRPVSTEATIAFESGLPWPNVIFLFSGKLKTVTATALTMAQTRKAKNPPARRAIFDAIFKTMLTMKTL